MNIEIIKPHRDGKVWVRRGTVLRGVDKLRAEELVRLGIARPASVVQTSALADDELQSNGGAEVFVQTSAQKLIVGNPKKPAAPRNRAQTVPADHQADASAAVGTGTQQSEGAAPAASAQDQAGAEPENGVQLGAAAGAGDEPGQS
jgi:hypothetical protein